MNADAPVVVFHDPEIWRAECAAEARRLIDRFTAVDSLIGRVGLTAEAAREMVRCDVALTFLRLMKTMADVDVDAVPDDPDGESPWANFK